MRTLFVGSTRRGYVTLRALAERGTDLVGVISLQQAPHETERYEGQIHGFCKAHAIPCFASRSLKDRDYAGLIRETLRPEIAFVVGCRVLIPPEIYRLPQHGMLAVHDSLLPAYRGFAPLNWSIINGETQTGVTLFYLNEAVDGGDIVAQRAVPIAPGDTAATVYERVCQATIDVIVESIESLEGGTATRIIQDGSRGSWTCSRDPSDGLIDWSEGTQSIYNLIRALSRPYPGAYTYVDATKLYIWAAQPVESPPDYVGRVPGKVVRVDRKTGSVDVLTGDGVLRLETVSQGDQEPERRAADVLRSVRMRLGLRIEDLLHRIAGLERRLSLVERFSESQSALEQP